MQTLDIIERSKTEEELLEDGRNIQQSQEKFDKLKKRLKKYQDMYADALMSLDNLRNNKAEIDSKLNKIEELISNYHMEAAKYADSLKEDKNFDIVARILIPLEECRRYCEEEAHRTYKKNNWSPITLMIPIV